MTRIMLVGLFLFHIITAQAAPYSPAWYSKDVNNNILLQVDLFISSTCPYCNQATTFLKALEKKEPWLQVHYYLIDQDKDALTLFYERLKQQNVFDFSVPTAFFCNSRWVGFDSVETTGKEWLRSFTYCRQQIIKHHQLTPATVELLKRRSSAHNVEIENPSTVFSAGLIPIVAWLEAFNPCAFFCFWAFLGFLWLYPEKRNFQWKIGFIFLLSLGAIHYLFQTQTGFYFQLVPWLRLPAALVGFVLFFYSLPGAWKIRYKLVKIPASLIYILVGLTAVFTFVYQQTCPLSMALVFEQRLLAESFSPLQLWFYHLMYQFFYLLPMALLLVLYLRFFKRRRNKRPYGILFSVGSCMLMVIAVILMIYPLLLSNLMLSIIAFVGSLAGGWILAKKLK